VKIVVDTNVIVSGIFWGGIPFKILEHWMNDDIELITSSPILNEYVKVISDVGRNRPEFSKNWVDLISTSTTVVDIKVSLAFSRDPDDNKFLECAASGGADCIVTGDDDLLVLGMVHGIPILRPSEFLSRFF
jgi:uncharacterized protein